MDARSICLTLFLAVPCAAQSANVDVGHPTTGFGTPSSAYGAGAAQAGYWNETLGPAVLQFLDGSSTTTKMVGGTFGGVQTSVDNPLTSGDDEKLMDDGWRLVGPTSSFFAQVNGLSSGAYYVYVYAMAPDATDVSVVTVLGSPDGPRTCGGTWPGAHAEGITYTRHYLDVGGSVNIQVVPQTTNGFIAGIQFVRLAEGIEARCFGTAAACPCGNAGNADSGCENSVGTGGGRLVGSGLPRIDADSVSLSATQLPPSTSVLFFQGTSALSGVVFGDGLRCAGGTVVRLATKTASASGSSAYPGAGDATVSVRGHVTGPSTREYQAWYRNAAAFCTPSTFNLTNGVSVLWQ